MAKWLCAFFPWFPCLRGHPIPMNTPLLPFSSPDLFQLKFIQAARLSPDGASVVYCVTSIDPEKEKVHARLWLFDLSSGKAHPLTSGSAADTNPQWSPDGKQIAFISTRSGNAQVYTIAVDGGEAAPLTSLKQGVGAGPLWSPDGRQIAFTAYPLC